jgi:hypothetical protein
MINLKTCRPGDKLVLSNGQIVKYIGPICNEKLNHIIEYPDGSQGTRTDEGYWDQEQKYTPHQLDVVRIIHSRPKGYGLFEQTVKYRMYADDTVVHEDDFDDYDSRIPYYDDYTTIEIPVIILDYLETLK